MPPATLDLLSHRPRPRPPWTDFALLTWNLLADVHVRRDWYPGVPDADLEPRARRRRLLAALRDLEADVMALQEVAPDLLPDLARAFPDHHLTHAPHHGDGLALLVRGGAERVETLELPGGSKRALVATLPGGWRLAVVHLTWTGAPDGRPRRGLAQLEAVLSHAPDVLCGDLNSMPGWPERERARAAGLVDATPPGPTCGVHGRGQALDAVMHRPGWRCEVAPLGVLPAGRAIPSPEHPSDHLPLRARLEIPAAALSAGERSPRLGGQRR